ncbi:TPA: gamma-mobile-trio protein GmtX [Raoultella ornithinolytica]
MEINVDSILQGLKDGKSTRTQQSLDTLNGILQHYVESGQRDFSVVQIGRISAAKDGPGYEAIRATRNQHYRDLINAWAQKCNTANSTSKCDTRLCRLTVLFEYLDRLPESETFPRS